MWHGDQLKVSRIIKYTLLIFVLYIALSTFTSMIVGVDNLAALSFGEYFTFQLLPSSVLAVFLYAIMANRSVTKAWSYAATVFSFGFILGVIIVSAIMQELYISPTWFIELPISLVSVILGTFIGIKWGHNKVIAT